VQILDLAPATGDYAGFRESITLIEGVNNVIERPFYLPRIEKDSLTKVEPDTITEVNNARLGMTLTVPPNTAKNADGSDFTGSLSISEVPRSLAPAPLPAELQPGLLVTIQPVGVQFSTPVPMTFPNIDKLAAGEEVDIWSIDPDRGVFTVVGTGQVSADETTIEMISGGIRAADWHASIPGSRDGTNDSENNNSDNDDASKKCNGNVGSSASIQGGCLTISHTLPSYRSLEQSRALRFVYNSESANPAPIINAESTLPARTALPKAFSTNVTEIGGMAIDNAQYIKSIADPLKHAVQFDGKNYPTGQYAYSFELSSHYEASIVKSITKDFVLINNEINSPFGAGWTLAGLQRIYPQQGRDRVTITEGDGSIKAFTPQGAVSEGIKTDLAFVIDGSGSIDNTDFKDQLEGFAIAISNPLTVPHDGSVSITVVQFSDDARIEVPLTAIDSKATADSIAGQIRAIRQLDDGTAMDLGIEKAVEAIGEGTPNARRIICMSTDGEPNDIFEALAAADSAIVSGIDEIDAIGIGRGADIGFLEDFVRNGTVYSYSNFAEFAQNIGNKIRAIVGGSPEGEFSFLSRKQDGSYVRKMKDGTEIHFNAKGLQTAVIDRNGNQTSFEYDSADHLIVITDPVGKITTFTYGSNGLLNQVQDPANRITNFTHDSNGNLTNIADADSSERKFTYDAKHLITEQTDKRNNITKYFYIAENSLLRSERPDGSTRGVFASKRRALISPSKIATSGVATLEEPADGMLASEATAVFTDGRGLDTVFRTNKFGQITLSIDALERTRRTEYDENGLVTKITRANDSIVTYSYDQRGNLLTSSENTNGATTKYTYEPTFSQVTSITDPDNNITTIEYDDKGNPISIKNALGDERLFTYNDKGQIETATDERSNVTEYTYNADGNILSITNQLGGVTNFTYGDAGNMLTQSDAEGRITEFTYDSINRIATITDPLGGITNLTYDNIGNLETITNPTGQVTEYAYDELQRRIEVKDPISGMSSFAYDKSGNLLKTTNSLGDSTEYIYDDANQLTKTIDALGYETETSYNIEGNIATVTDENDNVTQFVYDNINRLIERIDPKGNSAYFTYDKRNNLERFTNRRNQRIVNSYDALSRLSYIKTPDNDLSFTYDKASNLTRASDNDSDLISTYDSLNRLETVLTTEWGTQPEVTLTNSYDKVGNRLKLETSIDTTSSIEYSYNDNNLLETLTTGSGKIISFDYDAANRLTNLAFPNSITSNFTYDTQGRLENIIHQNGSGNLLDLAYGYNNLGNISSITEPSKIQSFTYDKIQQLITGGSTAKPENYQYDPAGNREASHLSAEYSHDAANHLEQDDQFDYIYDKEGNLTSRTDKTNEEVTIFTWDAQNKLTKITHSDNTETNYRYDALGRRIEKNVNSNITKYVYDSSDILVEFDENNNLIARYNHGNQIDQPLAVEKGGQNYFFHSDHLGSIRKITDESGDIATSYEYDSFGNPTTIGNITTPYGFTGREYDAESGLYYYRARYYNPQTGRFISEDPIGFDSGDINLYRYVGGNPLGSVDPLGLYDIFIGGAMDNSSGIVKDFETRYSSNARSDYFQWFQQQNIINAIKNSLKENPCESINLIGHSYGGTTATNVAEALAEDNININLMITIDPASRWWSRSDKAGNVDTWINVLATPSSSNGFGGDTWATFGGRWGNWPDGRADNHYTAPYHHNEFSDMMNFTPNDGISPLQALQTIKIRAVSANDKF